MDFLTQAERRARRKASMQKDGLKSVNLTSDLKVLLTAWICRKAIPPCVFYDTASHHHQT
jgi:hypothetical protein